MANKIFPFRMKPALKTLVSSIVDGDSYYRGNKSLFIEEAIKAFITAKYGASVLNEGLGEVKQDASKPTPLLIWRDGAIRHSETNEVYVLGYGPPLEKNETLKQQFERVKRIPGVEFYPRGKVPSKRLFDNPSVINEDYSL